MLEIVRLRAKLLSDIRSFFSEKHVLEIDTPVLSRVVISDAHIEPFVTRFSWSGNPSDGETLYLHTSPERHMKRLLAQGAPDIYQICKVFRNGESGAFHSPEFTMLEWYRRGFSMDTMIDETVALCRLALGDKAVQRISYQKIFEQTTGLDPLETGERGLRELLILKNIDTPAGLSHSNLLQLVMSSLVEPSMPPGVIMTIDGFPAAQAALARLDPADSRVSLRFEIYYNGVELGNGFEELEGGEQNRLRMEAENEKRRACGRQPLPLDEAFIRSMDTLPQCSGVAVGLDRLIMLAAGKKNIGAIMESGSRNGLLP